VGGRVAPGLVHLSRALLHQPLAHASQEVHPLLLVLMRPRQLPQQQHCQHLLLLLLAPPLLLAHSPLQVQTQWGYAASCASPLRHLLLLAGVWLQGMPLLH
jgi:hypothetical protein